MANKKLVKVLRQSETVFHTFNMNAIKNFTLMVLQTEKFVGTSLKLGPHFNLVVTVPRLFEGFASYCYYLCHYHMSKV